MSRFGDFLSNTFAQAKSHEPGWVQRLPSMPGSPQSLQDAFIKNKWNDPYGKDQNSMDLFAGGVGHPAGSEHPWARGVGRAVGTAFVPYGGAAKSLFGAGQSGGQGGAGQQSSSGNDLTGMQGDNSMGTSIWSQVNIPQDRGRRSIDEVSSKSAMPVADQLASQGRHGDTNLLHVSDEELSNLNSTGKLTQNPRTGLPEAFSFGNPFGGGGGGGGGLGDVFGGILGGGLGNKASGDITNAGNRGVSIGAPLENVQRQPYQQQLTGLMNDPSSFLKTDPFVQASGKAIGDQYQANFAKSGNLPFSSIQGSAAMQQMMSQAYNDRVKQLTTLGGFDQGPGYGGNIAYQSGKDAATIGNNSRTGGINQIFGGLGGMMGGSGSGVGGLFSGFGKLFGGGGGGGIMDSGGQYGIDF